MNNLSQALEVAISVRQYLSEITDVSAEKSKKAQEIQEKILKQVKNFNKLP